MGRFDEVKATINANIKTNGKQEITGKVLNHVMNEMIDATDAHLLEADGRYPKMSVGFADDLVGRGESVPAEFSFRASGGKSIKDGAARIKRLKGNSVVWNNMVDTRHLQGEWSYQNDFMHLQNGHIYAFIREIADAGIYCIPVIDGVEKYDYQMQSGVYGIVFTSRYNTTPSTTVIYNEKESGACNLIDLTLMFEAGNEPTTIEEYNARKPIVADEYAYNEGEVIHMTAEGIKSVGDNAWDEEWELGFIDPTNGNERSSQDTIRSKNFNKIIGGEKYVVLQDTGGDTAQDTACTIILYDEDKNFIDFWGIPEVYRELSIDSRARYFKVAFKVAYGTTYKNDVMISLMHSGWKADTDAKYQPYWEDRLMFDKRIKDEFPDGMSKWDMVYNKNGKGYIVKGTGVVDLGSLNWELYGSDLFYTQGNIFYEGQSLINNRYTNIKGLGESGNMYAISGILRIYDSSYTDAASLKASLQGVMLYYQLAEPTIIEYDEPFNLDYRVADFGTEEIIAPQPSAPISADIIYQFNAVDMIREHELEINELQKVIATMQAQLASLTSPTKL